MFVFQFFIIVFCFSLLTFLLSHLGCKITNFLVHANKKLLQKILNKIKLLFFNIFRLVSNHDIQSFLMSTDAKPFL